MVDITFNGMTMEFDIVAGMMDAELKAEVLATLNNPDEQQLVDAYMPAHKTKYGKEFLQA